MNTDIRLAVNFKGHRKRKRLKRFLGTGSLDYLIDLWLTVAMERPDGILHGWTEEDIADSAGYDDDPSTLINALIDSGWLDQTDDGVFVVHDWDEHQGWACGAKARSDKARHAARTRWDKRNGIGNAEAMPEHAPSNAPSPSPSPSPSPYPNPSLNNKNNLKFDKKVPIPEPFPMIDQMRVYAKEKNYAGDLSELTEDFILYHHKHGSKFKDWYAAWQTWLRNQIKWNGNGKSPDIEPEPMDMDAIYD
jgi:hypothetical protein